MAGFDTAVRDVRGKLLGRPAVELPGGSPAPLRAYASLMRRDITPAAEVRRLSELRGRCGFSAFEVRAGSEVGQGRDECPGRTEEIIAAIGANSRMTLIC